MIKNLFLLLIASSLILQAQNTDELNRLFDSAIKDFKNSKYASSLKSFDKIANEYPLNSKTSLSLLFIGKVNLELKNFPDAKKIFTVY
jgi:TolA-binding protein